MSLVKRRRLRQEEADLNITAFMNLMVALVPFLLIMAVFSRVAILELHLPKGQAAASQEPPLNLEVIVRGDSLTVADHGAGQLQEIPNRDGGHDLAALSAHLQRIKARVPKATAATILLEPQVPYEQLVQVMDALRVLPTVQEGQPVKAELFPDISIGDAPPRERRS